jgi:hypothetical protein
MTNLECAIAVLTTHREARKWADEAVAQDLLAQLGLDPGGDAKDAVTPVDPSLVTEAEVVAAETAAKEATDKAQAARDALVAQHEAAAEAAKPEKPPTPPEPVTHIEPSPPFVPPVTPVEPAPLLPAEPVPPHA